jgi:apolipoprotein N-acyltransferase
MSASVLRAAVVQLNSQDQLQDNLTSCARLTQQAAEQGAQMVLLPENFAYFGSNRGRSEVAEDRTGHGPIVEALSAMARTARVTVIAGGMPERSGDAQRPYNTAVVLSPQGEVLAHYRKIHLFDVELSQEQAYRESAGTSAGAQPVVIDVAGWKVGLSICYDLRFPELYRALVDRGAEVLVVPAAFTKTTGTDHWHPLLRARAIENQCWLLAAAQWGNHPGDRQTYGHSMGIDPWGTIVAEQPEGVGVQCVDLDPQRLHDVRQRLPALQHRRL